MKRKPINKISSKQAKALKEYKIVRLAYLEKHMMCERCGYYEPTMIHHLAGRQGKRLTDPTNFAALCRHCHQICHANPKRSMEEGWMKNRLSK